MGHNIKNAQASLQNGTHYDGTYSYDSMDLFTLMSTVDGEQYSKLSDNLAHKNVIEPDKQSDECALQRIAEGVLDVCKEVECIAKTDVPEKLRPYFTTEGQHNNIDKPFFPAVSRSGLVFVTDEHHQSVFFYRQSGIPRQIRFIGGKSASPVMSEVDPLLQREAEASNVTWKCVAGLCFFQNERYVLVVDSYFRTIRVISANKVVTKDGEAADKVQSISNLRRFPNMQLKVRAFKITNKPNIVPFSLCEVPGGLIAVTDPVNRTVEILKISGDMKSAFSTITVHSEAFIRPFDVAWTKMETLIITDPGEGESGFVHVACIRENNVLNSLQSVSTWGVCTNEDHIFVSAKNEHIVLTYDPHLNIMNVVIGFSGEAGVADGPLAKTRLTSPVGLACRGSSLYIAERPDEMQGAVRVVQDLTGLIKFQSIWQGVARSFGMVSRREKAYLTKSSPQHIPKTNTIFMS